MPSTFKIALTERLDHEGLSLAQRRISRSVLDGRATNGSQKRLKMVRTQVCCVAAHEVMQDKLFKGRELAISKEGEVLENPQNRRPRALPRGTGGSVVAG